MRRAIITAAIVGLFALPAFAQIEDMCDPTTQPSCPGAVPPTLPECNPVTQPSCPGFVPPTTVPAVCDPTSQPSCPGAVPPAGGPESTQPSAPSAPSAWVTESPKWEPDASTVREFLFGGRSHFLI